MGVGGFDLVFVGGVERGFYRATLKYKREGCCWCCTVYSAVHGNVNHFLDLRGPCNVCCQSCLCSFHVLTFCYCPMLCFNLMGVELEVR